MVDDKPTDDDLGDRLTALFAERARRATVDGMAGLPDPSVKRIRQEEGWRRRLRVGTLEDLWRALRDRLR